MLSFVSDWWRRITTKRCEACHTRVQVNDYETTGQTRKGTWWEGSEAEFECPHCGHTFWAKS